MTVLLFYNEITHGSPAGFYEAPPDMIVRLIDDWMKAHPYGQVVAMTPATFHHTSWYAHFLKTGWGPMTYKPENENGNTPRSQSSN